MTEPIKIGFILLSNSKNPIPSTRIVVLNMLPYLRAAGFDPHIVFDPEIASMTPDLDGLADKIKAAGFKIIFLQKVFGNSVFQLVKKLRSEGIKTVFSICDLVIPDICAETDATIVVTEYLKSCYPKELQYKISVVHDGIERPEIHKDNWGTNSGSTHNPLRAILVTSFALDRLPLLGTPPHWLHVTIVGRYPPAQSKYKRLKAIRWELENKAIWSEKWRYFKFLTNRRITCEAWGSDSVYQHLKDADIGIIPIEVDPVRDRVGAWKVKSENRLTLMMAMGLPVVATPIPSYEEVIRQRVNGFLARSTREWMDHLSSLRSPLLRQEIGVNARQTAINRYSMDFQAERLIKVLLPLCE